MNYKTVKSLYAFYMAVFIFKGNEGDCLLTRFFFHLFSSLTTEHDVLLVNDSLTSVCLMPSEREKGCYGINSIERCSQCSTPGRTCDKQTEE